MEFHGGLQWRFLARSDPRNAGFRGGWKRRHNSETETDGTGLLPSDPRLSVQLGLRCEYTSPPSNQLGPFYVPNLSQQSTTRTPKPDCQFLPAQSAGLPDATFGRDLNNLAPRVGFAWRPVTTEHFVERSAYGIFYDAGVLKSLARFQEVCEGARAN